MVIGIQQDIQPEILGYAFQVYVLKKIIYMELKIFLNEEPKKVNTQRINVYMSNLLVALPGLIKNAKYLPLLKIKL